MPNMRTTACKSARSLLFMAAVITASYFSARWVFFGNRIRWPIDFNVFWLTGSRPLAEIYADHPMPFAYPPSSLFLFKPFSLLPFYTSYILWTAMAALLFGIAVFRICGVKVTAISFLSPAATKGITLGQSSMLLGGALFVAIRSPPISMGCIFGLVAVIKPQIVVFAPLAFLIRREWSVLTAMVVAAITVILFSFVFFGASLWLDWIAAFSHFHDVLVRFNVLSMVISPAGRAEYLGLPPIPSLIMSGLIGATAVILLARHVEDEMLLALIVGASLATSPYAHTHDTIALVPACVVMLQRCSWPLAVAAALIVIGTSIWTPIALIAVLVIASFSTRKHHARSPS